MTSHECEKNKLMEAAMYFCFVPLYIVHFYKYLTAANSILFTKLLTAQFYRGESKHLASEYRQSLSQSHCHTTLQSLTLWQRARVFI